MVATLDFLARTWALLISVLGALGLAFTFFDIFQIRSEAVRWWKMRAELSTSARALAQTNHFIAHLVHVGGEFSMIYSLAVRVDSMGGWYLNPPNRFVDVWWNRGGNLMLVGTSSFTKQHGKFVAERYRNSSGNFVALNREEFCGLPISGQRNAFEVRFVRDPPIEGLKESFADFEL